jgi:superfamily II DNA or RNA helicase
LTQEITLTEKDVYFYFGNTYAARGDVYERSKRVSQLHLNLERRTISGQVQGSERFPYAVRLFLHQTLPLISDANCSCPMGGMCKHSAALLLHAIRTGQIGSSLPPSPLPIEATQSAPPAKALERPQLSPSLKSWVASLTEALSDNNSATQSSPHIDTVLYFLDVSQDRSQLNLRAAHARKLKTGGFGQSQRAELERMAAKSAAYVTEEDSEICQLFLAAKRDAHWMNRSTFPEIPEITHIILEKLLATGRCYWKDLSDTPLRFGPAKKAMLRWQTLSDGKQVLKIDSGDDGDMTVVAGIAWYINLKEARLGPLDLPVPLKAVRSILAAPPVEPHEAAATSEALNELPAAIPKPHAEFITEVVVETPLPRLRLTTQDETNYWHKDYLYGTKQPLAMVKFDYGMPFEKPGVSERRTVEGNKILIHKKDLEAEAKYLKQLKKLGLFNLRNAANAQFDALLKFSDGNDEGDWLTLSTVGLPVLKEAGWQVEIDKSFKYDVVVPEEEWVADATEGSNFWFSLDLGITIDGKREPLLPIIHAALRRVVGADPMTEIEQLNKNGIFYAQLKDGRYAALPFERVRAIVTVLLELFDRNNHTIGSNLEVTLPQIMQLSKAVSPGAGATYQWLVGKKLQGLIEKIRTFEGLIPVAPPKSFKAKLRPYQLEGLSWLNFLREFELGGILADDMGLGKTVQTLAHIAIEKHAKRLDKPYLVICPTSVLPNWLSEIEKFAPKLKVTALWGPDRGSNFPKITGSDIVVTTYPLVPRDIDTLIKQGWKAVVLDEAQFIKNPATQVAQAVGSLRADYRICLTGTPVENHLGELWSQFNFLMPGLLKDLPTFTRNFRTPIEKQKNKLTQKVLAAKVRPFLLRRTKELVAKELPEKTVIIKRVELEGAQRDLYEAVRLAMYEKVKEALTSKGLARSQIVILDALLKLRQVCCDPRLVSLTAAKKVDASAKLHLLLEMLEELIAEGKNILLFSQFTSMLDLIILELNKRKIGFVEIRGDTQDRATPVKMFQAGKVPLFLLSLKAGGTGLNLTAADTVIHYDPWWNPAVENQATDRAHRIGQEKAVFVFKLIASGTIEERMLDLQDRKKAIAEGVYGEDNALQTQLTAADLEALFTPLAAAKSAPTGMKTLSGVEF